jgi:hypothetical protein
VKRCVQVSAAIADDRKTVIGVSSVDKSGKDHTAGRNAIKNQCVDVIGRKNHGEIRAGEGADSVLCYDNFIVSGRDGVWERS